MAATPSSSGAPWSNAISADDHGPLVSITACLMLVGMLLSLGMRLAIRWPWKQLLGSDDMCTIAASMFAVGQSIAIFEAVHYGLGRHRDDLDSGRLVDMEKAVYAGDVLFVIALMGSKLALSFLVLRLASAPRHTLAARIITILILVWGFAAVLAVAIRPDALEPWKLTPGNASHLANTWIGVEATSILLEVAILALPVFLVWDLQMPLASKLAVIIGFAFRIPTTIIAILRTISLHHTLNHPTDISWSYIVPTMYASIEMHYSLIAATIPCMRIFLKNFTTGWLGTTADQVDHTATMDATKGSNSYALSSMSSHARNRHLDSRSHGREEKGGRNGELKLRGDDAMNITQVTHPDNVTETGSNTSDGSDRIIIRKTVQVGYDSR